MKFGWLIKSQSYHIVKVGKDINASFKEECYITLCKRKRMNFIDNLSGSMFIHPCKQLKVSDLSYNTLCKKCIKLSNKKEVIFELVKAKLCK